MMLLFGILIGLAFPLVGYGVEQCTWAAEKYSWEHLVNWYTWPIVPFAILYQKHKRKRQQWLTPRGVSNKNSNK